MAATKYANCIPAAAVAAAAAPPPPPPSPPPPPPHHHHHHHHHTTTTTPSPPPPHHHHHQTRSYHIRPDAFQTHISSDSEPNHIHIIANPEPDTDQFLLRPYQIQIQTKSHQIRSEHISSNSCHISSSSDHIAPTLCVHWCVETHIDCLFQSKIRLKVCWHPHLLFTCAMQPTQFASFILKSS